MAKSKASASPAVPVKSAAAPPSETQFDAPGGHSFRATREMIESIVVAFVLAFLFRTFEAEAFVIPTGSMSPSLLGQHKDISCPQCSHRYTVTASSEGSDDVVRMKAELRALERRRSQATERQIDALRNRIADNDTVGGVCPMCRFLTPCREDLPESVRSAVDPNLLKNLPTYTGDKILVNKYGYDFSGPKRWDVVVFKFPGDGNMNYIKRLVGMPGESLQIYQGDLFARPMAETSAPYKILRKPADKTAAMLQLVHDTDYEPSTLYRAGWPLRWAATTPDGWKIDADVASQTVEQTFRVDLRQAGETPAAKGESAGNEASSADKRANSERGDAAWLRYRHVLPDTGDWLAVQDLANKKISAEEKQIFDQAARPPRLINDFNAYNARLQRNWARMSGRWEIVTQPGAGSLGTEWVGDLAVECDVEIQTPSGELLLDVVEAGYHFRATFDLSSGNVTLGIVDGRTGAPLDFKAEGTTSVRKAGNYRLRLANVDDQILVWVDDELIDCGDATYDPDQLLGGRESLIPWASSEEAGDQGDLAPAGIGARAAHLSIDRLKVYRDIYYIATKASVRAEPDRDSEHLTDYTPVTRPVQLKDGTRLPELRDQQDLFLFPDAWPRLLDRRKRTFAIQSPQQYFVMGDNSPESQDCRLWYSYRSQGVGDSFSGRPGGSYLERRLMIGEAVCVFWPHSWGSVPGLPVLPGFPNFGDMRLIR